jgi:hypothetical protein
MRLSTGARDCIRGKVSRREPVWSATPGQGDEDFQQYLFDGRTGQVLAAARRLDYLAELPPAGSPIMFKYSCINDGTQISSRSSWLGIHLKRDVVITNGLV